MLEAYVCNRATNALRKGNEVHGVLRRVEEMTGRPWASLTSNLLHGRHYFLVFCVWDYSETCFVIDASAREGRGLVFVTYFDVDRRLFEAGGTVVVGRLKPRGHTWAFVAEDCLAAGGTPLGRHRPHRLHRWYQAVMQHYRPSYADAFLLRSSPSPSLQPHTPRPHPPPPPPPPPPRREHRTKTRPFDGRLVKTNAACIERRLYLEPSPTLPDIYDMYETPSPHARAVGIASVQTLESSRKLRLLFGTNRGRVLVRCRYDAARNKWEPVTDDAPVPCEP